MAKRQDESWRKQREEIGRLVRKAPRPSEENTPPWIGNDFEIEESADFWNRMAAIWDDMDGGTADDSAEPGTPRKLFRDQFEPTSAIRTVLDIGCGTGTAFQWVWNNIPNALITGIDQSPAMLEKAISKYPDQKHKLKLIEGSCLTTPFGRERFDYAMSKLTVHHFPLKTKLALYKKIHDALKPGGRYVELDQSTTEKAERKILSFYDDYVSKLPGGAEGAWNYDITLSVPTQKRLLREAGFSRVELVWDKRKGDWEGMALLVAARKRSTASP